MTVFFKWIDSWNMVRLLQIVALLNFLNGLFAMLVSVGAKVPDISNSMLWDSAMLLVMHLAQILYAPFILLALAAIIKTLKENKNDRN